MPKDHVTAATPRIVRKTEAAHPIEKVGAKLRSTMSWIKQSKIKKGASQASSTSSPK